MANPKKGEAIEPFPPPHPFAGLPGEVPCRIERLIEPAPKVRPKKTHFTGFPVILGGSLNHYRRAIGLGLQRARELRNHKIPRAFLFPEPAPGGPGNLRAPVHQRGRGQCHKKHKTKAHSCTEQSSHSCQKTSGNVFHVPRKSTFLNRLQFPFHHRSHLLLFWL